ncbi:hypothetical protein VSDG_02205 [Cytospora chrysosperma]|uniref:Uncharacterized protein n=1 Tax=Cytospora chrysosperma TaxID=252740 RepID=A0A423WE37_CYTCH|nr:hypothetical protein VSDG_02205 [Valsa sordida]
MDLPLVVDKEMGKTDLQRMTKMSLAYWEEDETWYLVTVLPLGGLHEIGIAGDLREMDLIRTIPACYEVDRQGFNITGWKHSFLASGYRASEREFPCLFFDEDFDVPLTGEFAPPNGRHYSWVSAKDLRHNGYRQPGSHKVKPAGRVAAENFRKRSAAMQAHRQAAQLEADMSGRSSDSVPGDQDHGHVDSSEGTKANTTTFVDQVSRGGSKSLQSSELGQPTGQG